MTRTSKVVPFFAAVIALGAIVAPALAQIAGPPVPVGDCPESVNCAITYCNDPCTGRKRCASDKMACCCGPTGGAKTCACQTASHCTSPPTGTQCS